MERVVARTCEHREPPGEQRGCGCDADADAAGSHNIEQSPGSPVREAGAAATIALLLGEMNNPWPIPKSARANITSGRLPSAPSSTANSRDSAATQMRIPGTVSRRGAGRSESAPPAGANGHGYGG